jgi:hypothetical protein
VCSGVLRHSEIRSPATQEEPVDHRTVNWWHPVEYVRAVEAVEIRDWPRLRGGSDGCKGVCAKTSLFFSFLGEGFRRKEVWAML